ncbi:DUF3306 domain-containing protein [Labrenzia sp. DG1229]|uniref:DUF3306 domain-containing protein n=1 Tax=Labrenzia sp. DG1229 TaxID=681847 RepID=UPI00055F9F41|nr:DUF3306 domain-containing protein [Labrenzia sp. DG1229]
MSGHDETGGDFWSKRKVAVRKAEQAELAEKEAEAAAEERAELEQKSDQEILEELGLPDPDTLTKEDDFSGFLSATVPERLRRRALRKLWGINPVLANLDGLVDYGDDFTDAATVVENMQTVYRIGKGMLDQFAQAEDEEIDALAANDENPLPADADKTSSEESVGNTALHNDYIENEKASVQLTQADGVVQADEMRANPTQIQETEDIPIDAEPRNVRRRLRFDYS